jgi:hypothetical protein
MMEAVSSSETSVSVYQTTRRNIPAVSHLHSRRRENLKSHEVSKQVVSRKSTAECQCNEDLIRANSQNVVCIGYTSDSGLVTVEPEREDQTVIIFINLQTKLLEAHCVKE